ncbi:MAG: sulfite exporter TauE/SafE family protein [Acidimicrobiales bacterium]
MDALSALAIAGAGLAAGTINTVVGSGTLITFPTLLALGYPPLVANVSNTIGLVPGSMSGVHAYRRELRGPEQRRRLLHLCGFSLAGGAAGSVLLLALPGTAFRRAIPWLILLACALVLVQPSVRRRLAASEARAGARRGPGTGGPGPARARRNLQGQVLAASIFATGVYGGYFGAAQGVILISVLAIFIADHLQRLNAVKNVLALLANLVAGVIFAFSGHVSWPAAAVLAAGAVVGGQVGGRVGRHLPQPVLRSLIVAVGTAVAILLLV